MKFLLKPLSHILGSRNLQKNGEAQKFIDSEVVRKMEPYTPMDTGFLKEDAPKMGTVIGSGRVVQKAPYAKTQYYLNSGRHQTGLRGKMWFERMKADHKEEILRGAAQITGGESIC